MVVHVSDEEKKLKRKKIAFCIFGPALVPVAFVFTAFWCITAPFREVVVYPFASSFRNFKTEHGLVGFHNCLRQAFINLFFQLVLLPIQLILFCICLLPLLCLWIKSALVGLWRLANYIFSENDKILASNRLKVVTSMSDYKGEEEGSEIKTRIGAFFGYIFGIHNLDVELSKTYKIEE